MVGESPLSIETSEIALSCRKEKQVLYGDEYTNIVCDLEFKETERKYKITIAPYERLSVETVGPSTIKAVEGLVVQGVHRSGEISLLLR